MLLFILDSNHFYNMIVYVATYEKSFKILQGQYFTVVFNAVFRDTAEFG